MAPGPGSRTCALGTLAWVLAVVALPATARGADAPPAGSPREMTWEFLDRVHRDALDEAATYLSLPRDQRARGRDLAARLGAVLDHAASIDLEGLSAEPEGDREDGLNARLEDIGEVAIGRAAEAVRIERLKADGGQRWRFTTATVARIDDWYGQIRTGAVAAWMPAPLRAAGPYGVAWWQWIGLVAIAVVGLAVGRILGAISKVVLCRLVRRTRGQLDDDVVGALLSPLTAFWSLSAMRMALPLLALHPQAGVVASGAVSVGVFAVIFWAMTRAVDVACAVVARSSWARAPASRALIPLARRVLKVIIAVIGAVSVLSRLGYPVASLIAGLGIGGIAIALAAQKTVENLFGAFSLGVDQPIREGDFVKIEDLVGTVESIGLRSTRIRTLDRTLVSIPNGKLAELRLESFAVRDRLRLACNLRLVYAAPAQLARVTDEIRATLRAHPLIWPESINVHVASLSEDAVNLEIMCWFQTTDWPTFQQIRHDLLLRFLQIVADAGTEFAFPPRGADIAATLATTAASRRRTPVPPS